MRRGATQGYNRRNDQDFGNSVGFTDEKSKSGSRGRRATLPSSLSPGANSPGKAGGILKKKIDDDGYLKSIKEDYTSEGFNADDSRGYSMTQHGDDNRIDRSLSKISDSRLEDSIRDPSRPAK